MNNTSKNNFHGTNNIYYFKGCPALMSDGRLVTYHNSANDLTEDIMKFSGIKNYHQFRNFMQNNGVNLMNSERVYHMNKNLCFPNIACSVNRINCK